MVFVCHVTFHDYMIKVFNEFMATNPSKYLTILPSLVAISTVEVLVCGTVLIGHEVLQEHTIKKTCDFIGRNQSM